jgi:hypothetical protein
MKVMSGMRAGLIALAALVGAVSVAHAESGTISIRIFKAGFIVGGSAGEGVLNFEGRSYPLSIGGLSYGFTFGASETRFHGTVSNIHRAGRAGHCARQPNRRRAVARRRADRPDRQRGFERTGADAEVRAGRLGGSSSRHGRACPGHPRLCRTRGKTWLSAIQASQATPFFERLCAGVTIIVIAGLDPAIHAASTSQHGPPGQARW